MRVVLDTNVLISAFLFGGQLDFIVELLQKEKIIPCFSLQTWNELERVLRYSHIQKTLEHQRVDSESLLNRLSVQSALFKDMHSSVAVPNDPDDEQILACAEIASAEVIVTGDKHLLAVAKDFFIPIVTPKEFKSFMQSRL